MTILQGGSTAPRFFIHAYTDTPMHPRSVHTRARTQAHEVRPHPDFSFTRTRTHPCIRVPVTPICSSTRALTHSFVDQQPRVGQIHRVAIRKHWSAMLSEVTIPGWMGVCRGGRGRGGCGCGSMHNCVHDTNELPVFTTRFCACAHFHRH